MIINEKRLCKFLKRAYKEAGYKIVQNAGQTFIGADNIIIKIESQSIPRQLLGMLVEHYGDIPVACSIQVMKDREAQLVLSEALIQLDIHLEHPVKAVNTPIDLNGHWDVYQCEDLQTFGLNKMYTQVLMDRENPIVDMKKQVAAWYGENMEVILPIITKKENAHLAALESHRWTF